MLFPAQHIRHLFSYLLERLAQNVQYYDLRGKYIGIVAAIGFPLYYYVWHDLYPQPYENLTLRLIGSALFIPLIFSAYWPDWAVRFKAVYWNMAILYGLPFFFTFMLLMNGGSAVWVQSLLVAIFVMVLVLNAVSLVLHFLFGVGLAWLAYLVTSAEASSQLVHNAGFLMAQNPAITVQTWYFLPIVFFAILIGVATNFSTEIAQKERERAILDAAGSIAHELRTPLLGISAGAAGVKTHLPALLQAYRLAQENQLDIMPIRKAHLNAMEEVMSRIEMEARYANTMVDMLIVSARGVRAARRLETCSINQCIAQAVQRYPFATGERQLVDWQPGADFTFRGSELQIVHVLFNLMKNALRHLQQAGKGSITISTQASAHWGTLIFRDTGTGVPPEILPHIFTRFYTTQSVREKDHHWGAGIGLAFCQEAVKSMGGHIRCRSDFGEFTEFVIRFPITDYGGPQ